MQIPKIFTSHTFFQYSIAIIVLWCIQLIDYGYFAYLHNGLKFPDYFIIMLLSIFLAWKYCIRKPFSDLIGIDIKNKRLLGIQFLRWLVYWALLVAIIVCVWFFTKNIQYALNLEYLKNLSFMLVGYLFFIPLSALYEELHYRWLYISLFDGKYARLIAILISAIIFSYVHIQFQDNYPIYYPINMFLFALILSLLRLRYQNIIFLVGVHSAWNLFLILLSPLFGAESEKYAEFTLATTFVLVCTLLLELSISIRKKYF